MKKYLLLSCMSFFIYAFSFSQNVGIGTTTPDASAKLDVSSTTTGALIPRMTTTQRNAIVNPAVGLLVYDNDKLTVYMYNGHSWLPLIFGSNAQLPGLTLGPSDGGASKFFGYNVSISGDYAIVGCPLDSIDTNANQGSAYIFYKSNNGWIEQAKLTASDGAPGDGFGSGVGISGNYVVIGAYADKVGNNSYQGSAYIFFYNGTAWIQQAKLTASDGADYDFFGSSVSINGDYSIIGSYSDDIGVNTDQGSAYIFYKGSGWTTAQPHQPKIIATDGAAHDNLGVGVDISGDYAIIGSSHGLSTDKGCAYIFGRIGTSWIFLAQLTDSDGITGDLFGCSVDMDGDYAIIGAGFADVDNNTEQGCAYIFYKGSAWTTGQAYQAKLIAIDGGKDDQYGIKVSISGDHAIVGAFSDDVGPYANQGSAYLYKRNGTTWKLLRRIDDSTGQTDGAFGMGVGISGYNLLIGAYGKNNNRGEVTFLNFQ